MSGYPFDEPDKYPLTPEQRARIARLINEASQQAFRITPTQAAVLGFPTRDPETGLLKADFRLFTTEAMLRP